MVKELHIAEHPVLDAPATPVDLEKGSPGAFNKRQQYSAASSATERHKAQQVFMKSLRVCVCVGGGGGGGRFRSANLRLHAKRSDLPHSCLASTATASGSPNSLAAHLHHSESSASAHGDGSSSTCWG